MPDSAPAAPDFAAQLAALRDRYVAQLGHGLDDLVARIETLGPGLTREQLEDLHGQLHRLAGSGGTFGFPELSQQARVLEVGAKNWLNTPAELTAEAWRDWAQGVRALRATLDARMPAAPRAARMPVRKPSAEKQRVVLIEDDADLGQELAQGLRQFGYQVEHYTAFEAAQEAILRAPPDVLVVDIMLPPVDGTRVVPALFARLGYRLPLIFITANTAVDMRMAAAHAGGEMFLVKPVGVPRLADSIESLLAEYQQAPYRVLIVDDDVDLAEHYQLTLRAAGMLAEHVSDLTAVWRVLEEFRPDLVLMDLDMPGYSGADVARAIRYDDAWQSLPIVFLSAEVDVQAQGQALSSGADEFLVKPIGDAQLVVGARARAMRARKLDQLMNQDSLTGLLKHASIKDRLAQEVDRARRLDTPMSVAMVDIDFFKRVNDTWGHPVGDQVIRSLGQLLRQRLRRQDSVGRYGGEEFLVVLPECTEQAARQLLDDIRQRFSEVCFHAGDVEFSATFSAGVAAVGPNLGAEAVLAAADAALYQAKQGGRNQVRVAGAA